MKLNSEQQQENNAQHDQQEKAGQEFATAEDLLRFDAAHTVVPPGVAKRLQRSTEQLPSVPKQSWWRRFFGGGV